jgi:uncharacterized protein
MSQTGIGEADTDNLAGLCSDDVEFEIPGDDGALPGIGRKAGRSAVADFIRGLRSLTEPVKFDVQDVLASEDRARSSSVNWQRGSKRQER